MSYSGAEGITHPPVDGLIDKADSKYALVLYAAKRARQINAYFSHLGEGLGQMVPPQVSSVARKPLSISFEEIAADKIEAVPVAVEAPAEDEAVGDAVQDAGV